jgi:hypothetical protein
MQDNDQMKHLGAVIHGTIVQTRRGAVFLFPYYQASDFWKLGLAVCDGGELSRKDFAGLFNMIGTQFGAGNGETTFNLPKLDSPLKGLEYVMYVGFDFDKEEEIIRAHMEEMERVKTSSE